MPSHHQTDNTTITAVIYKLHDQEYLVFVEDPAEYEAWKTDKSIALARFVGQFSIFKSQTSGHTGQLGEISKQELETVFFGDDKNVKDKSVEAAIILILENGHPAPASFNTANKINKNPARGAGDVRAPGSGPSYR